MSAPEPTAWQAIPTKELTRIADELAEIADVTEGVLHASLSQALSNQIIMLRYHAEQAPHYNEAAATQGVQL